MGWSSAIKKVEQAPFLRPSFEKHRVDWDRLVSVDFETYFDDAYTLKKLSTSEYVRDKQFSAHMAYVKIGKRKARIIPAKMLKTYLKAIDWSTHSLLAHHNQFDGFILSTHFGIKPKFNYCTLSMARGLHSNEIGAGLDEVSQFYGGGGKTEGVIELMRGVKDLTTVPGLYDKAAHYCMNDGEEMYRVFKLMIDDMPADEIELIHRTCVMFNEPVLKLDRERALQALAQELQDKEDLLFSIAGTPAQVKRLIADAEPSKALLKKNPNATPKDAVFEAARKKLRSSEQFADLLRAEGIEPPRKISPAWKKLPKAERTDDKKYSYAFAQTDLSFKRLLEHPRKRVRQLVEARFAVMSNTTETRAGRMLKSGERGASLPIYYRYAAAHTLRFGGGDKRNYQNLERGGELRKSILAPKGFLIAVGDSGQIEVRVTGYMAGQDDLLEDFRLADQGLDRDVYCKFGDVIYGREINKVDEDERFVSKVGVLSLGYGAGHHRFQSTLALGQMGPPVFIDLELAQKVVNAYRRKNWKIVQWWGKCEQILEDMATGRTGTHKCISWEKEKIWLPNGMCMKFPNLRWKKKDSDDEDSRDGWVYTRKGNDIKIYGAMLCENISQALARIIVTTQLLDVARLGWRVVMTTHDEIALIARIAKAKKAYDELMMKMKIAPHWAPDIPLNCDGKLEPYYAK